MQKSILIAILLALFSINPANAQLSLNAEEGPKVKAQLIAEQDSIAPGQKFWVALRQEITPGWHTYWSNPGDTGLATSISWQLPQGFSAGELLFPTPNRYPVSGMVNYGYEDSVMQLVEITAPDTLQNGDTIDLKAKANWLVCHEICIPESATFLLQLDVRKDPADGAWASAFTAARAKMPQTHTSKQTAVIEDGKLVLTLEPMPIAADMIPEEVYFFPHDGLLIDHMATQDVALKGRSVRVTIPLNKTRTDAIETVTGDLWLRSSTGAQSFQFMADVPQPPKAEIAPVATPNTQATTPSGQTHAPSQMSFLSAIFFAFLGGIILNLMPCVFPVLSLKALGLVHKSHKGDRRIVIASGIAYLVGVLTTFTIAGLALVALKAAGNGLGWGAQLQSPNFVAATALLLFFIGYYLSGSVSIGSRLMNVGNNFASQTNLLGSFFTGALAVIVATPCTAPFMGGAIFYALTQNTFITLAVLWALGFGLALPYVLLTLFPQLLLKYLPKPGVWMEHFKQFLAFPMIGAAIWLVWVLSQQTGPHGVMLSLTSMLFLAFGFWVWSTTQNQKISWWQHTKTLLGLISIIAAIVMAVSQPKIQTASTTTPTSAEEGVNYETFTPEKLAASRAKGEPVFINMTAAWCITCLANEKTSLSAVTVKNFFKEKNIRYLKGDWTNYDPAITQYLESFGRSGVPIYVFYSGDQTKQPVVLPQLLTPNGVIEAIQPNL